MGTFSKLIAGAICTAATMVATSSAASAAIVIDAFNAPVGDSMASTTSSLMLSEPADGLGLGEAREMNIRAGTDAPAGARTSLTRADGYLDVRGTGGAMPSLLLHYASSSSQSLNLETNPIFSIDLTQFDGAPATAERPYVLETVMIATLRSGQSVASRNPNLFTDYAPRTLYYHFHMDDVSEPIALTDIVTIRLAIGTGTDAHLRLSNFTLTDLTSIPAAVPEPGSLGVLMFAGATVMVLRRRRGETVGIS